MNRISKAASILGKLGGIAKSKRKTKAVRANGRKGGRPRGSRNKPPRSD